MKKKIKKHSYFNFGMERRKKKQKNVKLERVTIVKEEKYGEYKESSRSQMVLVRVCQPQTVGIAGVTRPVSFFLFQVEWETNLGARKKG
jgi:hypothetical protein